MNPVNEWVLTTAKVLAYFIVIVGIMFLAVYAFAKAAERLLRLADPWEDDSVVEARCASTWHGHRCVLDDGHHGIHFAEDETDWFDGDADPVEVVR